ncbi:hypothetical protein LSH36_1087g00002 [Paralvinella palmiformis]|uniref:Uncharacterized protein n=1 Tax=Paralvinella palmiformis TaxID=53620 RepID=A0AAD9IWA6_9ANNE|nr:hypothetical protein LSH36_1087g00002 [Paralvinella palmiformis]
MDRLIPRIRSRFVDDTYQQSDESRLASFLMSRYARAGRIARPLRNSSMTMTVEFSLALIQILDFDETNQVLTTNTWKRYRWIDELLTWNPEHFGGIKDIRLPSDAIWTPDIVLYNNAERQEIIHHELLAVYSDGTVRWVPPAIYKSSCQVDMRNFPFDEQQCILKFGSWTYDGEKLDLAFYDGLKDMDIREYVSSSEWIVMGTEARYHVRYYPCCGSESYPDITFYLTMKRKTAFYVYVLILPSVLLSCLTLILFWIPPQRPDRTGLGMSLFSSFFVLLLILVQSSPPTSDSISLLGLYYCVNMILIAFSTMLSAIVINLTHYLQKNSVPRCLKIIFIRGLSRVLCAQSAIPVSFFEQHLQTDTFEEEIPITVRNDVRKENGAENSAPRYTANQRIKQAEWRTVASVLDRLFFLFYVLGIVLSLIFVFPR